MSEVRFTDARLGKAPAKTFKEYMTWPVLIQEARRFPWFLWVDRAHTVMLYECGIIEKEVAAKILRGLAQLEKEGMDALNLDADFGSYLFQVERYLGKSISDDVAGRMHTARGRADYQSASLTLMARDSTLQMASGVIALQRELVKLAKEHNRTLMPGYTHYQHAQPTTFGHYILGHFYPFQRDFQRLLGLYARSNMSTLGNCSRVGTDWPINRYRTAELLGHDGLVLNAQDQTYYRRDHHADFAAVAVLIANNLARLATDLDAWYSEEFDMLDLPAEFCGSSSIMPQKKNPYPLERARAVAGESIGWIASSLGIFKVPHTSAADPSFSVVSEGRLFEDANTSVAGMLRLFSEFVPRITIKKDRMDKQARDRWNVASRLGDVIVEKAGLPFRVAHRIVGRLVRWCTDEGIKSSKVTSDLLDKVALEVIGRPLGLGDATVKNALDPWEFVLALKGPGSANPDVVAQAAIDAEAVLNAEAEWLGAQEAKIAAAREKLVKAIASITG